MRAIRAFFDSRGMPPAYPSRADERGKPMETSQSAKTAKIHRKNDRKSAKTTGNQRKANENKRNPSNINGMIARKSQLSPDSP
ncbi:MAG: hypothetical protein ACLVJM_04280 [Bifidobacterium adolescentis]